MEIGIQSKECLDVAVDHRIRALCKPVTVSSREPSKRISRIKTLGESLGRSRKEIQVTTELAGPAVKGGIAITLQQPRGNHPFEEGIDNVIADCETLYALYEIFPMVSCGTLDIRSDISIIDLLPYISDDITEIDDADLTKFFNESTQAICDKEPDVLLCAGKIWLPKPDKFNKIKGDARKLESIGFGRMFGQTPKLPVQAKIRGSNGSIVSINRVNGFHPSQVPPPRYIPDYQELYYNTVIGLKQASTHLLSDPNLATSLTINYESLLSSNLSETCNNASLILRQMDSLFEQGWPDSKAWINESALEESAKDTCQVMRSLLKAAKDANGQRLSSIIQQGAKSILDCAADNKFDLEVISRAFLELAMNIETLLSDLWLGKKEAFGSSEQEEMLSNRISSMTLESDFVK
ncbi:hypothetical protein CFE70_007812 [Pyrenophora teres f. teres 0-1]